MDCQGYLQDNFSDNLENANNLVENENGLGDAPVNLKSSILTFTVPSDNVNMVKFCGRSQFESKLICFFWKLQTMKGPRTVLMKDCP